VLQGGCRRRARRDGPRSDAAGGVGEVTYARSNGSIIASSFHFYVRSVDASLYAVKLYSVGLRGSFLVIMTTALVHTSCNPCEETA
jgi:hypothetical protein